MKKPDPSTLTLKISPEDIIALPLDKIEIAKTQAWFTLAWHTMKENRETAEWTWTKEKIFRVIVSYCQRAGAWVDFSPQVIHQYIEDSELPPVIPHSKQTIKTAIQIMANDAIVFELVDGNYRLSQTAIALAFAIGHGRKISE